MEIVMNKKDMAIRTKDGLPRHGYAITGDLVEPDTWKLPHHNKGLKRAYKKGMNIEETVDWELMVTAVAALSPKNIQGSRLSASPGEILGAAQHLADHYIRAGKPLPDILAVLT